MIAPLLEALREKDPATWQRFDELELATYKQYDDFGATENYIYQEDLIEPACLAWMQAVLQEACQARGWAYQVSASFQGTHYGKIVKKNADESKTFLPDAAGDSPAEALLRCYLGAIG